MKHLARYTLLLIVFPISVQFSFAQSDNTLSTEASQHIPVEQIRPKETGNYTSLDGRFTVSIDPYPMQQHKEQNSAAGPIVANLLKWPTSYGQFAIAYIDRPEQLEKVGKEGLDSFRDYLLANGNGGKGKLVKETDLSMQGHPGRELKIELPDSLFLFRIYLVNQRMYQVSAVVRADKKAEEANAAKTLDSFRLLSQSELEAESKKRLADAIPVPLPQEPIARKMKSDREDEGMKGKVKTVVEESKDLPETAIPSKSNMSFIINYNEQGNFTKKEFFDYRGNLYRIEVFGYLDGDRASKDKTIQYEYDPPPVGIVADRPRPKPDPRYGFKYKYRYDDKGRLIEIALHSNYGSLWMRYAYNYKVGQKEELVYAADGSLNQKRVYKLDDKGNEVEEANYRVKDDSISDRYSYNYEFDSQGNWIKRTTSQWVTKDGKSFFEPVWIHYRTISYY